MAAEPTYTKITVTDQNGVAVVRLTESKVLEARNILTLGNELLSLPRRGVTRILINFQGVDYLSSAALGKLITLSNEIKKQNGQLKLCEIARPTMEVFKITKLDDFFEIYRDQVSALSSFHD